MKLDCSKNDRGKCRGFASGIHRGVLAKALLSCRGDVAVSAWLWASWFLCVQTALQRSVCRRPYQVLVRHLVSSSGSRTTLTHAHGRHGQSPVLPTSICLLCVGLQEGSWILELLSTLSELEGGLLRSVLIWFTYSCQGCNPNRRQAYKSTKLRRLLV